MVLFIAQRMSHNVWMAKKHSGAMTDDKATELVMQLMAVPGGPGQEGAVQQLIKDKLLAAGVPASAMQNDTAHKKSSLGGEVGNLIVKLPGAGPASIKRAPRRLFSAHTDTVPICVGCRPVRKGNTVTSADSKTGLGGDDRAGCAVVLSTALSLLRAGQPHPPLTLLFTVQEEAGLHGARHLTVSKLAKPALAFNFDGGDAAKMTIGATGGYRMTVIVKGIASHAGNAPEKGVSAIGIASLAIADLVENGWHGQIIKAGKQGTSNVGVISGGAATNVVTDHVTLRVEARSHDAKFRERIVREIEKAFNRAVRKLKSSDGKRGSAQFDGGLDYEAFKLSEDHPSVVAASEAAKAEGADPVIGITNGGLDANWLNHHGIPAVTLGCGQRNIHTVDEELDLREFHLARRIAWKLAGASLTAVQ